MPIGKQGKPVTVFSQLLAVNLLIAGIGFLTNVAIANHLGREAFGQLSFSLAIGMYALVFVQFGMDRTFVRELVHYPERASELVSAGLILRGILIVVAAGSVVVVSRLTGMGPASTVIALAIALSGLHLQGVFDAWGEMGRHATYFLLQRFIYFGVVWFVLIVRPGDFNLAIVGGGLLISVTAGLVVQYLSVLPRLHLSLTRLDTSAIVLLIRSNMWVWLSALVGLSFVSLTQILLRYFKGDAELGGFAVCLQMVTLANLVLTQVARIGRPATAKLTRPNVAEAPRRSFFFRYLAIMSGVALVIAVPCLIAPHLILRALFAPEYWDTANTLRLLGIYIVLLGVGLVASQFVVHLRKDKWYFTVVSVAGVASVLLSVWLIPRYAGVGAAVSLILAHGVAIVGYMVSLGHRGVAERPPPAS